MNRCSKLLITREIRRKATVHRHLTPVKMTVTKKTRSSRRWTRRAELGTLLGGSVIGAATTEKLGRRFLKRLRREPPHAPALLLVGIFRRKHKH